MEYNFYKDYREYSILKYDEDFDGEPILCNLKYDLKEKRETITIETAYGDEINSEKLPLGYTFVGLMNIDLGILEKALNDIYNLKIFENNMTLGEYIKKLDSKIEKVQLEDIQKEKYINDVQQIKHTVTEAVCSIASLHPYLIKYSQAGYNTWLNNILKLESNYLENADILPKYKYYIWQSFINSVISIIKMIKRDIGTIQHYKKIVDLCLNVSRDEEWNGIPFSTRLYIAGVYYDIDVDGMAMQTCVKMTFQNKPEHITAMEDEFRKKNNMIVREEGNINFNEEHLPPVSVLREIYSGCSIAIEERIETIHIYDVCLYSLVNMARTETGVKECANCGRYFIPLNRSDTIYCDGMAPQDSLKTCKKYGAEKQYQENLKNDEAANKYRLIYMKLQMLVKRNPDIVEYKQRYEEFKALAKQWKSDVKEGKKTRDDYLQWLNMY